MKRATCLLLATICLLNGCSYTQGEIQLFCREEGSGTRENFARVLGLAQDGVDLISPYANVTNLGAVMLSAVEQNVEAIGFLSAASVSESSNVKTVAVNGQYPADGKTYPFFRHFLVAYNQENTNPVLSDFVVFLTSDLAAEETVEMGYFPAVKRTYYDAARELEGKLTVAGSASVYPLMNRLSSLYMKEHPGVTIEVQQNDSSTGLALLGRQVIDLAMSSRELTDDELSQEVVVKEIAGDAIAIIVHPDNMQDSFTMSELSEIFSGSVKKWDELNEN